MSSRLIATIGLICMMMALSLMYMPFVDVYANAAAKAEAESRGEPVPASITSFVWPTQLPASRGRTVLLSVVFATVTCGCLFALASRRSGQTQKELLPPCQ
jgi:hypothetical protein